MAVARLAEKEGRPGENVFGVCAFRVSVSLVVDERFVRVVDSLHLNQVSMGATPSRQGRQRPRLGLALTICRMLGCQTGVRVVVPVEVRVVNQGVVEVMKCMCVRRRGGWAESGGRRRHRWKIRGHRATRILSRDP